MYTAVSLDVDVARTLIASKLTFPSRSSGRHDRSDAIVRMATSSDVVVACMHD